MAGDLFVPCTSKYLPLAEQIDAAAIAVNQNPQNSPGTSGTAMLTGAILPPEHLAVLTSRYWGNKGVKLSVAFMEPIQNDLKNRLLSHFNAWSEFANVQFYLSETDPQVRVTRAGDGYWSYLGTDILTIPKNEPTMCLQAFSMQMPESEFRRVVRHEVGHTLGFPHEHMRRQIIDRLDSQKTIAYFKQTQGWSAAMTQQQVLTPLAESSLMATPDADENSIMTYTLPGQITKDGRAVAGGLDIESQDAAFVGRIYPKAVVPPPPPKPGTADITINLSLDKKTGKLTFPTGWTLTKSTAGANDMSTEMQLVDELEALVPVGGADLDALKQSSIGGVIGSINKLITAVRSGDYNAALLALIELLQMVAGQSGGSVSFAQSALGARFDWSKLIGIITKLLPLILGAL